MVDCLGNRLVVLGTALFAALYLVAGAMMASVGLVTFIQIPHFFRTGCIIWSGFVIFLCGVVILIMSVCNKNISLVKTGIMIFLSAVILIISVVNIIIIELVEWKEWNNLESSTDVDSDSQNTDNHQIVFLAYLLGLLGSVIGLVTSIAGIGYIYFTLAAPALKETQQRKGLCGDQTRKSVFDKYRQGPKRKFTFKLTPPPEVNFSTMANWDERESDPYHVSWVYDDQSQETRPTTEPTTSAAIELQPKEAAVHVVDNRALMDEIREKVGSRRLPSSTLAVTAQVNIVPSSQQDSPASLDDASEPILGRIGQLPPNTRSSFRRRSLEMNRQCSTPL